MLGRGLFQYIWLFLVVKYIYIYMFGMPDVYMLSTQLRYLQFSLAISKTGTRFDITVAHSLTVDLMFSSTLLNSNAPICPLHGYYRILSLQAWPQPSMLLSDANGNRASIPWTQVGRTNCDITLSLESLKSGGRDRNLQCHRIWQLRMRAEIVHPYHRHRWEGQIVTLHFR